MVSTEVQRTLVKSPPELWAELSEPDALARHLGELGEIRITRLKAESEVHWEAELATGVVLMEPSGWGTRVKLSVTHDAGSKEEPVAAAAAAASPGVDEKQSGISASAGPADTAAPEVDGELHRADTAQAPPPEAATAEEPTPEGAVATRVDEPATEPVAAAAPAPTRRSFLARLFEGLTGRRAPTPAAEPATDSAAEEPAAVATHAEQPGAASEPAPARPEHAPAPPEHAVAHRHEPRERAAASAIAALEARYGISRDPSPTAPAAEPPAPVAGDEPDRQSREEEVRVLLTAMLDRLGSAHHRPFSRS